MKNKSVISALMTGIITLSLSCSSGKKIIVDNVRNIEGIPGNSFIYALPQTIVELTVTACETTIIPGPYHQFAEQYLNIETVPATEQKIWSISDISIKTFNEADKDYIFVVKDILWTDEIKEIELLLEKALILTPDNFVGKRYFESDIPELINNPSFTNL